MTRPFCSLWKRTICDRHARERRLPHGTRRGARTDLGSQRREVWVNASAAQNLRLLGHGRQVDDDARHIVAHHNDGGEKQQEERHCGKVGEERHGRREQHRERQHAASTACKGWVSFRVTRDDATRGTHLRHSRQSRPSKVMAQPCAASMRQRKKKKSPTARTNSTASANCADSVPARRGVSARGHVSRAHAGAP